MGMELSYQRRVALKPQIGDIVVEVTHIIGLAKHQLGLETAVGELIDINPTDAGGVRYTLKTLDGETQNWENASMVVIERPE